MGISLVRAVLNKVPSEEVRLRTLKELDRRGIEDIGTIYYDPGLSEAGFDGETLGDTRATEEVKRITSRLFGEAG